MTSGIQPRQDTDPMPVLRASWPAPAGVHALTTQRGSATLPVGPDDGLDFSHRAPAARREWLASTLALPASPLWLRQVHGVAVADAATAGGGVQADASVCHVPGVVLAVLTADCLPVTLCHATGTALGVAHAGWRGLVAGILEATVEAMRAPPGELLAWLGPAIGPHAFEVGDEVRDAFLLADPGCHSAFAGNRPGHWLADLYALARRRLAAAGVHDVHGGTECTYSASSLYFSFRRDKTDARMATLLWRNAPGA